MMTIPATRPSGRSLKQWLPNIGVALIVLYCLAPFYWMTATAFRRPSDQYDISALPKVWSLENFRAVFEPGVGFDWALFNSLVVASVTTGIGMTTAFGFAAAVLDDLL